jgi:predicted nucleic acid-binding protein
VTLADAIVFDAEALVAFLTGEPGSDRVAAYVETVDAGRVDGYVSPVTTAAVAAVARGLDRGETGRGFLALLAERGVESVSADDCWGTAAMLRADHGLSLGDAFAVATAFETGSTLLAGTDDNFDGILVETERFRDDPT